MAHWKHNATRCAVEGCERTRIKGRTTCGLVGHYERGVSLYGLRPDEPRLKDAGTRNSGAIRLPDAKSAWGSLCDPRDPQAEQDALDAALDAAEFNDPREQDRLDHEADLRYEYSKPEYHEFD